MSGSPSDGHGEEKALKFGEPRPAPSASCGNKPEASPSLAQRLTPGVGRRLPSAPDTPGPDHAEEGKA